jgi:hypothetical protein
LGSRYQGIAIQAPSHQAILDNRGRVQLLNQEQSADNKQKSHDDAHQPPGLSSGCLVFGFVLKPMVMSIHRILPLELPLLGPLGAELEATQGVAECDMFR